MSTRPRERAFAATCVLIGAVVALLVLTRPDEPQPPPPAPVERAADRPEVAAPPAAPNQSRPEMPSRPRARRGAAPGRGEVARAAETFAGDWLEYLAGTRPVSAVRHIAPKLTLAFAGGDPPHVGPGRAGLQRVTCRAHSGRRYRCAASIDGLEALQFVMSTDLPGGRVQVSALALD